MKTLRYVFFLLGLLTPLNAMDSSSSSSNLVDQFKAITWETHDNFIAMQKMIDKANVTSVKEAKEIHKFIVMELKKMELHKLKTLYEAAEESSPSIATAVELVGAYCYSVNLSNFDCVDFFHNNRDFVRSEMHYYQPFIDSSTRLFTPEKLPYVLPLLEPIIGTPIRWINFSGIILISFPVTILQLEDLLYVVLKNFDDKLPNLAFYPEFKGNRISWKFYFRPQWRFIYGSLSGCGLL
jgi:hypothetical protein